LGTAASMTVRLRRHHAEAVKLMHRCRKSQRKAVTGGPKIKPHDRATHYFTEVRQAIARWNGVCRELDSKTRSVISHDDAPSRADRIDDLNTGKRNHLRFRDILRMSAKGSPSDTGMPKPTVSAAKSISL
jgi:hypothetical protein